MAVSRSGLLLTAVSEPAVLLQTGSELLPLKIKGMFTVFAAAWSLIKVCRPCCYVESHGWGLCAATWVHSDVWTIIPAKVMSEAWSVLICVAIQDGRYLWSMLQPEVMLLSVTPAILLSLFWVCSPTGNQEPCLWSVLTSKSMWQPVIHGPSDWKEQSEWYLWQ